MTRAMVVLAALAVLAPTLARAELDALVWIDPPEAVEDAVFQDGIGAPRKLADFNGRVVLLNFWATWCVPCRREMPSLDRLQERLGGPDFTVVAVSEDRGGIADAKPFLDELGVEHLDVYADPSMKLARVFGVIGLPSTFIVDHQGRKVAQLLGDAEWDSDEAIALLEPLIDAARKDSVTTASKDCSCGGPKAARVRLYGTVAPPPDAN